MTTASEAADFIRSHNNIKNLAECIRITLKASNDFSRSISTKKMHMTEAYHDADILLRLLDSLESHAKRETKVAIAEAKRRVIAARATALKRGI